MIERPLYFGERSNLLGVLTAPAAPHPGSPAVILLNAGLLHRVGPNRLHVDVARRLAEAGFTSLRFDMSGVGDSELPGDGGLLDIERSRGRDRSRGPRYGPRTLDLDLLAYGGRSISTPSLILPHPRLHERRFVLEPLADIAAGARLPVLEATPAELLTRLTAPLLMTHDGTRADA